MKFGLFSSQKKEDLNRGLEKTKESLFRKISRVVVGKSRVDDEVLDNLGASQSGRKTKNQPAGGQKGSDSNTRKQ